MDGICSYEAEMEMRVDMTLLPDDLSVGQGHRAYGTWGLKREDCSANTYYEVDLCDICALIHMQERDGDLLNHGNTWSRPKD